MAKVKIYKAEGYGAHFRSVEELADRQEVIEGAVNANAEISLDQLVLLCESGEVPVGSFLNSSEYHTGSGYGGNSYKLLDGGESRPAADGGSVIHVGTGGLYLYHKYTKDVDVYTFGVTVGGDSTTQYQNILNHGELTGARTLLHGHGYHYTEELQSSVGGWHFKGRFAGRITSGGTRLVFKGTGDFFTMGADDGLPWSDNLYNGPSGLVLQDINFVNDSPNRTTPLNCRPDSNYHAGSACIRDWRGGDIRILGSTLFEGFEWSIWGVNSDINKIDCLTQAYCKYGIYLGPRSDQHTLNRVYSYFCDTWLVIDNATHITINNSIQVGCGSTEDYAIIIKKGVKDVVFNEPWFEDVSINIDTLPYISIGIEDGYGGNTSPSNGVIVNNPMVSVAGQGSYGANHLFAIGSADVVTLRNINSPINQSSTTNLVSFCLFMSGFDHASSEFSYYGEREISASKLYTNQGTGNAKVSYFTLGTSASVASSTGRFSIIDIDNETFADKLTIGQEGLAGRIYMTTTGYPNGSNVRLDQRRAIIDRNILPNTGSYEQGDYVRNLLPEILGDSGSQYIIRGWMKLTTGEDNVIGVDWVEDRGLTGT